MAYVVNKTFLLGYNRTGGVGDVYGFDATGAINLHTANTGWRQSWDVIVSGSFAKTSEKQALPQIVLYDRAAGDVDLVVFDAAGHVTLDVTSHVGSNWDVVVPGKFLGNALGNGKSQVLLYDRTNGFGNVVSFLDGGAVDRQAGNAGWRTSWDLIVAGHFLNNGADQIVLYDRAAGAADVVGFDSKGVVNLDCTNEGWRTSWEMMAAGQFAGGEYGGGASQIVLYDRAAGQADIVGFDSSGKTNLDTTNGPWRNSWQLIVPGYYVGSGSELVLYDRAAGQADFVGFDKNGQQVLDYTNSGWRNSWDLIVAGQYLTEPSGVGGGPNSQIALYDRAASQMDTVSFGEGGWVSQDVTNNLLDPIDLLVPITLYTYVYP